MSPWSLADFNSPEYRITERILSRAHRHQVEKAKLFSAWSTVAIGERYGIIVGLAGSVQTASGWFGDFEIIVPDNYPYSPPRAYSYGWALSGPHCYEDSEMCLWRSSDWKVTYTLAYAVAKTYTWIHKHDIYLATGRWPGNEQDH